MIKKTFIVKDEAGLHARPASLLTQTASKCSGSIDIEYNGTNGTLKSIMFIMSLGIPQNGEFTITVENPDEAYILEELENILEDNDVI